MRRPQAAHHRAVEREALRSGEAQWIDLLRARQHQAGGEIRIDYEDGDEDDDECAYWERLRQQGAWQGPPPQERP